MSWTAPDEVVARTLRRRRRVRWTRWALGAIGVISIALAHAAPGHGATDWSRFHRQIVKLTGAVDGQTLTFTTPAGATDTLRLLGVAAPLGHDIGAVAATDYLRTTTQGHAATLLLDWPQTRDAQGRLMAFVFLKDEQLLNADAVRDGAAYAERRAACLLQEPIDAAERTARKAHRGLWRDLQWDQTPLWRRQWFATKPKP